MKQNTATVALLSLMLFGESQGFCPHHQQQQTRSFSSALHLLPGQGNQLAAAYTASTCKEENEGSVKTPAAADASAAENATEPPSSSSHWRALAASRSFVSRVFHMPSSAIKKHPHPTLEGLKEQGDKKESTGATFPFNFMPQRNQEEEDAVLYPLVGFTFVKSKEGGGDFKTIALPTTSHVACRLPTNRKEDVFGWYSPACKLDLYSEDVCHAPFCEKEGATSE